MMHLKKIWQLRRILAVPPGAPRLNLIAALICLMALTILFLTFQATPAGAGLDRTAIAAPQLTTSISQPAAFDNPGSPSSLSREELNRQMQHAVHGSRVALQLHVALLELGKHRIERFPDYTATFFKQERVDDALQDVQTIELKLRHKPFSVYMKWIEGGDVGRQALFVEGQNDDKLHVRLGGVKSRLPTIKLEPTGSMAMQESRYPITKMGLLELADMVLKYRRRDYTLKRGVRWEMIPDQKHFDRDCDCWIVQYDSRDVEPVYRKSITYIDKELALPICIRNFGWPDESIDASDAAALDEATLIEYYGYADIQLETRLSDNDFEKLRR